jgi:hypothetical protein
LQDIIDITSAKYRNSSNATFKNSLCTKIKQEKCTPTSLKHLLLASGKKQHHCQHYSTVHAFKVHVYNGHNETTTIKYQHSAIAGNSSKLIFDDSLLDKSTATANFSNFQENT